MAADNIVDIVINQKASFEVTFLIKEGGSALDLTDYSAVAKLKPDFFATDAQTTSFTSAITNAANGHVSISLTASQTANLAIQKYYYDLSIINSTTGFKTRVVEGTIKVSGGVS